VRWHEYELTMFPLPGHTLYAVAVACRAAKRIKPGALIVTHTPDPAFLDVTDMIRLNDVLHTDHPEGLSPPSEMAVLEQMTYRARVVRAACPEPLVDTDGWRLPGQRDLAAYAEAAPALGVPSLYYAERMESGPIDTDTWAAVAAAWAAHREAHGLTAPRHRIVRHGA
jgi:hypothetical protein